MAYGGCFDTLRRRIWVDEVSIENGQCCEFSGKSLFQEMVCVTRSRVAVNTDALIYMSTLTLLTERLEENCVQECNSLVVG